jgi:hypothetical protein
MSISSISSGFTQTYALLQTASEEQALLEQAQKTSQENKNGKGSGIGTEIMSLLSQVPKGDDDRLSFQDVEDYRETLGKAWDVEVMADLAALGVDVSQEMPMTYDVDTGKVTVAEGTEGKEIIDKYFEDNPEVVSKFYDIVQLGKLTGTAESKLSQDQRLQNIQLQTMAWWYEDNTDVQSWFDGGGLLALKGQASASYTGLNLMV